MRIVGGEMRGREIKAPDTRDTRPMTEHDREAIFNILGDINGTLVLDCYAGSGAIGLEALSRGAKSVEGIEIARVPAATILHNLQQLGFKDRYKLRRQPIEKWLRTNKGEVFDLVFADPPFDQLNISDINRLSNILVTGGLLILKHSSKIESPQLDIELIESRPYGDTTITFYRKT